MLLHELPGGVVVEFVAALEDQMLKTIRQAKLFVVGGRLWSEWLAAVAMIDAVFAAGLNLQRARTDQRGNVGVTGWKKGDAALF